MATRCFNMLPIGISSPPSVSSGCFCPSTNRSWTVPLVPKDPVPQPYGMPRDMVQSGGGNRRQYRFCRAYSPGKGGVSEYDYDLYELLGLDNSASQSDIRSAYRWLQKRCHPDVVGEGGHDMSILLNDAYAVLSDPSRRAVYDEVRRDAAVFDGFTGEPLYSVWSGAADEQQAVFVDESRCIGCLKCALTAPSTFAIENRYGRARAVRQWGDSEATIKDACRSCPVDCIWWVDRNKLPALEFIMSKQSRVAVGVEVHSNGGLRSENVFVAAEKFVEKHGRREEQKQSASQETSGQRAARMAAAEGIRARGGRWWHHWIGKKPAFGSNWNAQTAHSEGALVHLTWPGGASKRSFSSHRDLEPQSLSALYAAAAEQRRRHGRNPEKGGGSEDEYWAPREAATSSSPPAADGESNSSSSSKAFEWDWIVKSEEEKASGRAVEWDWVAGMDAEEKLDAQYRNFLTGIPVALSGITAVLVGMTNGTPSALTEMQITGPLPPDLTTSLPMQMFLAATVWYVVGSGVSAGLVYGSLLLVRIRDKTSV